MIKFLLSVALVLLVVINSQGQENTPNIIMPSPNATSLGIYGQIETSPYNGMANIQIPLYEIDAGIKIPISLSYNSGGIKVDQIASWVGLGWSLQAGGVITRVVRGLPDESSYGYMRNNPEVPDSWNSQNHEQFLSYAFGVKDSEPDEFYFNIPGYSGKFVFNQNGEIVPIPYQNLIFQNAGTSNFTIIDPSGNKYIFDIKEQTQSKVLTNFGNFGYINPNTDSGWFLSKIITPSNEEVLFTYDAYNSSEYPTGKYQTRGYPEDNNAFGTSTTYSQIFQGRRLSSITFNKGSIQFVAGGERCDLLGDKVLDYVVIKDLRDIVIKKIKFNYKYMYSSSLVDITTPCNNSLLTRLLLDNLQEISPSNNSEVNKPYKFEYILGLPERLSYAQDHWGFYNFNTANALIPTNLTYDGANRAPNIERAQCGSLKKVIYPTGGSQTFEYELNESMYLPGLPRNYINKIVSIGSIVYNNPTTFTLIHTADIKIKPTASGYNSNSPKQWPVKITVQSNSGVIIFSSVNRNDLSDVTLANLSSGTYYIFLEVMNPSIPLISTSGNYYGLSVNWLEAEQDNGMVKVGGIRVRTITTTEDSGKKNIRNYSYVNDNGTSSGCLVTVPDYSSYNYSVEDQFGFLKGFSVYSSIPNYLLANTLSASVGYSKVTEHYSEYSASGEIGQNGRIEYHYTNPETFPDDYKNIIRPELSSEYKKELTFPFGPPTSKEWKRGKLISKIVYKKDNVTNNYIQIKKNEYNFNYQSVSTIRPLKVGITIKRINPSQFASSILYNYYQIESGYSSMCSEVETVYQNGTPLILSTYYSYNNKLLPITIERTDSKNETLKTQFNYPQEMVAKGRSMPYLEMVAKNIISPIIEKIQTKNGTPLSLQRTNYYQPHSGVFVPDSLEIQQGANPIETQIRYHAYDKKGNLLSWSQKGGAKTCYIWSYNMMYPVAEIKNASYTTIETVLGGQAPVTDFNTNSNPNVLLFLSPLRTDPRLLNSQITTFTYEPLVGMTSSTDAKGQTTYYVYDDFQRLKWIKDQDDNILKTIDYHYQNQ